MSISGLLKLVLFNRDTGDVAQFNTLRNEGSLNINPSEDGEDSSGGIPYAGDQADMEAVVYDLGAAEEQVKAWMKANARIEAVGLGHQVNFLWYERTRFRIRRPKFFAPGTRKRATITANHTGGVLNIDHMVNLLHNADLLSDEGGNVYRIIFPVEGAKLTLSRDFDVAPLNTQVTIRALDYDEVQLEEVIGANSAGRTSAQITLPAGTWFVEVDLGAAAGEPVLRSDGKTEYINE